MLPRALILLAAIVAATLFSVPALAQQSGRWSWDALVGLTQRTYENEVDGQTGIDSDQQELELSFGLHGFVVHPAVASFNLGLDLLLVDTDGRQVLDTERYGLNGDIDVFPRGGYPLRLYFRQDLFDYSGLSAEDPFTLVGAPDSGTTWGGRFRLRRGPLRGLLLGVERNTVDFMNPGSNEEIRDTQFLDWSRGSARASHRFRVERRLREFGNVDMETDNLSFNLEERVDFSPDWRWEMFGTGTRRDVTILDRSPVASDDYRIRNRLFHDLRERDLLDIRYDYGVLDPGTGPSTDSHAMAVFYRWRLKPAWEIAPFARYTLQKADGLEVRSPQVGVSASWSHRGPRFDEFLSARTSFNQLEREDPVETMDETQFGFSFSGTLGHGEAGGLRKELEFEVSRNDLRFIRSPLFDPQDVLLPSQGLGTEESRRARVTLTHVWNSQHLSGWGEWREAESSGDLTLSAFDSETMTGSVQYGGHDIQVQASVGETNARQTLLGEQDVRFASASTYWRPARFVSVRGSYGKDTRELAFAPDVDGERGDLGVTVTLGQLSLEAFVFETTDSVAGGLERTNRGVSWSVSSRFAGWLPVVTGTKRNGIIR